MQIEFSIAKITCLTSKKYDQLTITKKIDQVVYYLSSREYDRLSQTAVVENLIILIKCAKS